LFVKNTAGNQWGQKIQCGGIYSGEKNLVFPLPSDETPCATDPLNFDPKLKTAETKLNLIGLSLEEDSPARSKGSETHCPKEDQWRQDRSNVCSLGSVE
jgi:hypothetical protein